MLIKKRSRNLLKKKKNSYNGGQDDKTKTKRGGSK